MKKNMIKYGLITILGMTLSSNASAPEPAPAPAPRVSTKPQIVKKETIIIKEKDKKKKDEKKDDGAKAFGVGLLGGFIGGALGPRVTQAREQKESVVTGKVTDRERRVIEQYASLEDDYNSLQREVTRLKRKIVALETDVAALTANNRDLKQDLETSRSKKRKYKELAIKKRDQVEALNAELQKYKPETLPAVELPTVPTAATSTTT